MALVAAARIIPDSRIFSQSREVRMVFRLVVTGQVILVSGIIVRVVFGICGTSTRIIPYRAPRPIALGWWRAVPKTAVVTVCVISFIISVVTPAPALASHLEQWVRVRQMMEEIARIRRTNVGYSCGPWSSLRSRSEEYLDSQKFQGLGSSTKVVQGRRRLIDPSTRCATLGQKGGK